VCDLVDLYRPAFTPGWDNASRWKRAKALCPKQVESLSTRFPLMPASTTAGALFPSTASRRRRAAGDARAGRNAGVAAAFDLRMVYETDTFYDGGVIGHPRSRRSRSSRRLRRAPRRSVACPASKLRSSTPARRRSPLAIQVDACQTGAGSL
jgi:hypothetical protein